MDIERLQQLAGLALDTEQREALEDDLRQLKASIDRLQAVDVDGVKPARHPVELDSTSRDDVADQPLSTDEALRNAPDRHGDYVAVPAVLRDHDD